MCCQEGQSTIGILSTVCCGLPRVDLAWGKKCDAVQLSRKYQSISNRPNNHTPAGLFGGGGGESGPWREGRPQHVGERERGGEGGVWCVGWGVRLHSMGWGRRRTEVAELEVGLGAVGGGRPQHVEHLLRVPRGRRAHRLGLEDPHRGPRRRRPSVVCPFRNPGGKMWWVRGGAR